MENYIPTFDMFIKESIDSDAVNEAQIDIDEMDPVTKKKLESFVNKHKTKVLRIFRTETTYFKDNKPDKTVPTGNYQITFETWSVYDKSKGKIDEFNTEMIGLFLSKSDAITMAKLLNEKDANVLFGSKSEKEYIVVETNRGNSRGFSSKDIL